ncbi:hypothetical protein HKX48_006430 [Thoreauomyces humboldtii]|nr:hypothetical protein HKX48_006430 [Thoreauomyces humboldtii]
MDIEPQQAAAELAAAIAAARPPMALNLMATSNIRPVPIDRMSEVPVRNVLRYLDKYRDYLAVTAAFRNFNAIGRTPGAALEFALNQLRRVDRGDDSVRRSEDDVWSSFLRDEFNLLFSSLHMRTCGRERQLERTQVPLAPPPGSNPFQGVYGTLDAMRYRLDGTQRTASVAHFPDWSDILAYRLPDKVEFGSPEFRLQVMQLAARVHGETCRAALSHDPNGLRIKHELIKAPKRAPDYSLLVRYGMAAMDMVGADATHLVPYLCSDGVLFEAYVLNGGDLAEQEDLKILSITRTPEFERTLLSIAILRPFPRVVKILLEHRNVDVTARHNQALACACSMGHMEMAKALVARGADLNDVGRGGHGYALPISFVAAMRDTSLLDEFLALGAIPNIPGREGEPLFLAVGATVLRDRGDFYSLSPDDVCGDNYSRTIPIAAALMKRGFVLGPLRDATLLLAAYAKGAHVMVELFKHRPMQKDQNAIDTALCIASLTLNRQAVHFLTTLGADMNCCKAIHGGQPRSPLGWAMLASALPYHAYLSNLLDTIDLLFRFGADANDPAILDEFLVEPVTVSMEKDPRPAAFVDATRRRFRLLATGEGGQHLQTFDEPLPAFLTTTKPDVDVQGDDETDVDDENVDDDTPLEKYLLTPEERAYDENDFEDDDAPWGALFRALLVRGMDPYAWPEKRYFDYLKDWTSDDWSDHVTDWSPSTVRLFREQRWKKRHDEKQGR